MRNDTKVGFVHTYRYFCSWCQRFQAGFRYADFLMAGKTIIWQLLYRNSMIVSDVVVSHSVLFVIIIIMTFQRVHVY